MPQTSMAVFLISLQWEYYHPIDSSSSGWLAIRLKSARYAI
jgi:hypothetical protein